MTEGLCRAAHGHNVAGDKAELDFHPLMPCPLSCQHPICLPGAELEYDSTQINPLGTQIPLVFSTIFFFSFTTTWFFLVHLLLPLHYFFRRKWLICVNLNFYFHSKYLPSHDSFQGMLQVLKICKTRQPYVKRCSSLSWHGSALRDLFQAEKC